MKLFAKILSDIVTYETRLKEMKEIVEDSLRHAPEGFLKSAISHGHYHQFYLREEDELGKCRRYRYLTKEEKGLITQLAQKEYDQKILAEVNRQIRGCISFLHFVNPDRLEKIYSDLPLQKRALVVPYIQPEEEYIKQWYAKHPQSQNPIPIQGGVKTDRGEWVRSKSEKIIADYLYHQHIPYVYEASLTLSSGNTVYPDFTILKVAERKTMYLEHLGRMGDPEYSTKAVKRVSYYNHSGIHLGDTLLITMETIDSPLDISILNDLMKRFIFS